MSIRLIATDLDGTLLNSQGTASSHTIEVLHRANDMGYYVVPATGRSYFVLPPELDSIPHSYLLINSGAAVIERGTGKYIYRAGISRETLVQFDRIIRNYNVACNYVTDAGPYMLRSQHAAFISDIMCGNRSRDDFWTRFFRDRILEFDDFDQWLDSQTSSVLKINLYFRDAESKAQIPPQLTPFTDLVICHSPSGDLEITDRCATKGKGLLALADHLHISPEEIIAFGDSDNDIEMFKSVGIGVAMANAIPETLAAADRITASNDEDGVARGIEQWVLNQTSEV